MKKVEFSKKLLIADYAVLILMIVSFIVFALLGYDTSNCVVVVGAWIGQVAISSGFYYWKSKAENLIKLPIIMWKDMPEEMRQRTDPNQVINTVIGSHAENINNG